MNIVLYTKPTCSYCNKAKMLLVSKNLSYQELKLNEDFTRASLLSLYPSVKTYPVIIIDGFNIGGYEELNKYLLNEETTNNNLKFLAEGA